MPLLVHKGDKDAPPSPDAINAIEADRIVENLQSFKFQRFGDRTWTNQHQELSKLNLQAHINAQQHRDEFVVEALLLHEKMPLLIKELVSAELWKINVYPKLKSFLDKEASVKGYLLLYNEAVLCNLLEAALYHPRACTACGDCTSGLVDWCHRRLVWLHTAQYEEPPTRPSDASALRAQLLAEARVSDHLSESFVTISYSTALGSLSIVRFLSEQLGNLPLGVSNRFLDKYDLPMLMCGLLERKPWEHRSVDGTLRRFGQSGWTLVTNPTDARSMAKAEVQTWLALYALVTDAEARRKYSLTRYRRNQLLKLRALLNEVIIDQLPPLAQLARSLDELSLFSEDQIGSGDGRPAYVLEELDDDLRDELVRDVKWEEVIEAQRDILSETLEERRATAEKLAALYDTEHLESLIDDSDISKGPQSQCKLEFEINDTCIDAVAETEFADVQTPFQISKVHKAREIKPCEEELEAVSLLVSARLDTCKLSLHETIVLDPEKKKQWIQLGYDPHQLRVQLHFLKSETKNCYHLIRCRATPPLEQKLTLLFEEAIQNQAQQVNVITVTATGHGLAPQTPFTICDETTLLPRHSRVTAELTCGTRRLRSSTPTDMELNSETQMVWRQIGMRSDELRVQIKLAPGLKRQQGKGGFVVTALRVTVPSAQLREA